MQKRSFQRGKKKKAFNFPAGSIKQVARAPATALPEAEHPESRGYGRIPGLARDERQLHPQTSTSTPREAGKEK